MKGRGLTSLVIAAALGAAIAGCGGSEQTAGEPKASFPVQILQASFPRIQAISHSTRLVLRVRNPGPRTIPNIAVTMDSFSYQSNFPGLSDRERPVWIIDEGPGVVRPRQLVQTQTIDPPGGGETAFLNTWSLGALPPGGVRSFVWHVTPVKSGLYTLHYTVAAGLNGNARAHVSRLGALEGTAGGPPVGRLLAAIAPRPPRRYVNPVTGRVQLGPYPSGKFSAQ